MRKGLTEGEVEAAIGDLDGSSLPARTVAALRLVDCLARDHPQIEDALMAELRRYFSDGEILELGAALAVGSGWQRLIEAFGIRPDGWESAAPPWLR